jgi:antitoxin component YwqK of YwqJK toxin-antitoxin module
MENYDNGKIKLTGYYKKSKPIGCWIEYYPNGKTKSSSNYAVFIDFDDVTTCLSGAYQEFYKTGQLKVNGFYSANLYKVKDTIKVEDPVSGTTVAKIRQHSSVKSEKFGQWEFYTETGELDKKQDY